MNKDDVHFTRPCYVYLDVK
jgi:hypothetical protein